MAEIESIIVADLESLLQLMEEAEFWVKWEVLCSIGPGWIGGRCEIRFYLGDQPLANTSFHDQLKSALSQAVPIPLESPDAVIWGEGDIRRAGDGLEVEYEWFKCIPYEEIAESGHGTAPLVNVSVH